MSIRLHTTLVALAALLAGAPANADDGDIQQAALLLEEARSFGRPEPVGLAAGQIEKEREQRRSAEPEPLTGNEQRWENILESQSRN